MIPPEKRKVIDKLRLRGEFGLTKAKFTDRQVQTKLIGLSRRGKGINNDEPVAEVLSNLRGRLILENGTCVLSEPHVLRARRPGRSWQGATECDREN